MLKFTGAWRFDTSGPIAEGVSAEFSKLIGKVAAQGSRQSILEHFKDYFAGAAGTTSSWSSSTSWAESDLQGYMSEAAANAPLFIEAFYDACESLQRAHADYAVPDVSMINRVLSSQNAGYQIHPPDLVSLNPQEIIEIPQEPLSRPASTGNHSAVAQAIRAALVRRPRSPGRSGDTLAARNGIHRVSGARYGKRVQGKYFNKIVDELRKHHKGKILDQVLAWVTILHGYLSSPTGDGIRHGTDLKTAIIIHPNEARLFCNLIRSYISYLMAEHARLRKA